MFTPVTRTARHHGRDGRPPLLLAAALAVALPGFLVSACSGQAGGAVQNTGQNDAITAAGRAVTAGRAPVANRRPGAVQAVRLLAQAAQAAVVTSYQGQELVVTHFDDGSRSVLVSNIWHVSGGQTVTQTLDAGGSFSSQPYLSSDTDGQAPEAVLGVTAPLLRLLESHYVMAYAGASSADNRTAQVVEARRADGSLAARFWLDDATKLPLERQVFDSGAHLIGQDVFIDVSFATQGPASQSSASQSSASQSSAYSGISDSEFSAGQRPHVGQPAGPVDRSSLARPAAGAARQRLAGPVRAARRPLAVHRRRDGGEHRHRARLLLLGRPVGDLGVRAARQPGGQAGRLAQDHGRRPRDIRRGAGSAVPDLVQPRHGVHGDGGRAGQTRSTRWWACCRTTGRRGSGSACRGAWSGWRPGSIRSTDQGKALVSRCRGTGAVYGWRRHGLEWSCVC